MPAMCATSLRASCSLGPRPSACSPASSNSVISLSSAPIAAGARLAASSGTPFFARLAFACCASVSLSAAEPTQNGPFFIAATWARMSGFSASSSVRPGAPFLIFCAARFFTR